MIYIVYLYSILAISAVLEKSNSFSIDMFKKLNFILIIFFLIILINQNYKKINKFLLQDFNIYLLLIVIICISSFFTGYMISQNLWDSMTYHLPRYLHWFQNGNLEWFYTANQRQNVSPILPDLLFASLYSLLESDRIVFLVTWFSVLVSSFYIYKIVRILTDDKSTSTLAFLLSLLIPSQIAFMSSTQTDPLSTMLVILALYYVILSRKVLDARNIYILLILIPLFITAKTTGLIFSIPIYIYFLYKHKKYFLVNFLKVGAILLIIISPVIPYLFRQIRNGFSGSGGVFVTTFSTEGVSANFFRIFASNLQTPIESINGGIYKGLSGFLGFIGLDLNPSGYGSYGDFYLFSSLHGDLTGNPLHVILIVVASIWAFKVKQYRWIPLLLLTQLGLLALLIGWQPWINRFTSTLLVIGSILIALWFSTLKKIYVNIFLSILIIYSSFWVFFNPSRSLLDPKPLVSVAEIFGMSSSDLSKIRWDLVLPREEQYFSVRPEIQDSYLGAIEKLNLNSSNTIFLKIGGDDYEYPIWALTNFDKKIYHFDGSESQLKELEEKGSFLFCTVECSELGLRQEYSSEFVTLWSTG